MATVTAIDEVTCMMLNRATFESLLGSMDEILQRTMQQRDKEVAKASRPKIQMEELGS